MSTDSVSFGAKPPSPYSVFKHRDFRLMWLGQFVSTAGSALTSLAASILVYQLTGSAFSVGLMLIATAAPSLLVGLFAGVFVDRYDRKRIMIVTELIRAVLVLSIPFLVPYSIVWLYVIVALKSAIAQFYDPAHESVLPEVAPEEELAAANSLMAISSFGSTAIGFAASGLIASAASIDWAFYADGITFLISAAAIALISIEPLDVQEDTSVELVVRNLKAGVGFLFDTPILRSLFYVYIPVLIAFGLSNSLLLPFADRALGATEFEYGLQEGLTSVGFVVGSLLMANIFDRMREGPWMALGWIGMGALGIVYSQATSIPFAILLVGISGFMNAPPAIAGRLIIQRNTPREMRGRVNSAFFVARDVLFIVGMASVALADYMDVRILYLISSVMILVSGVWVLFLPGLRQDRLAWQRSIDLLRGAPAAPGLASGRAATISDVTDLIVLVPELESLTDRERDYLAAHAIVIEVPAGTAIIRQGDTTDKAYFVTYGRAIAGLPTENGDHKVLNPLLPGEFFGEIAALTGTPRTADVMSEENTIVMQLPAASLRTLMANPQFNALVLETMTQRLNLLSTTVLPRFAKLNQDDLRDLRSNEPEVAG